MITFSSSGDFKKTENFLTKAARMQSVRRALDRGGRKGVAALAAATPVESGLTAALWDYQVRFSQGAASVEWTNSNRNGSAVIAILLQYGHGTGTGGYVRGRDYINPAIRPIFDEIADEVWKEVTKG